MSILLLGPRGQLGSHLAGILPDVVCLDRSRLDLADCRAIGEAISAHDPSVIVNAAAYTAVDRAESEPDMAWRINAEAPAELARAAERLGIPLLHVSTDYVFDGSSSEPYSTRDPVNPVNVYGRTKLAGELAIRTLCSRYWILRTSWVFSEHGSNFVKTMLRLGAERAVLNVVSDQRGQPTYAGDLARIIAAILASESTNRRLTSGLYHVAGGPTTTWFRFAEAIFPEACARGLLEGRPEVRPISTAEYPTPATRPANSILEHSMELDALLPERPDWRRGLAAALSALATRRS